VALRTPQRWGPTGKLNTEKGERGGVPPPQPNRAGERCISSSAGPRAKPRQKTDLVKFEIENTS